MIHCIGEGDLIRPGFNIISITDGGFVLAFRLGKLRLWWRWRGNHHQPASGEPRVMRVLSGWHWVS